VAKKKTKKSEEQELKSIVCPVCAGSGEVVESTDMPLELPCEHCEETGLLEDGSTCKKCKGAGALLTRDGELVMDDCEYISDFLNRHYKIYYLPKLKKKKRSLAQDVKKKAAKAKKRAKARAEADRKKREKMKGRAAKKE